MKTLRNVMSLWLFDTCNFRCGYCSLVETGAVERVEQLAPFRDLDFIQRLASFFQANRPQGRPWLILLTGGEPMLMPNLAEFCALVAQSGDTLAIYTNGSVPVDKTLTTSSLKAISYIQFSFHPNWHLEKDSSDKFFENALAAKHLGIPCLVRFVAAPAVLHLLPMLEARCAELGLGFLPTTLFDPMYPKAYTPEEKRYIASFMSGYSSLLQLDGGVVMDDSKRCHAAGRVFAARLSQGGDISPCISTGEPVIGNVFRNELRWTATSKRCFKTDRICSCDVHFQQDLVEGLSDSEDFNAILRGESPKRASEYEAWLRRQDITTSNDRWVGQGTLAHQTRGLVIGKLPE